MSIMIEVMIQLDVSHEPRQGCAKFFSRGASLGRPHPPLDMLLPVSQFQYPDSQRSFIPIRLLGARLTAALTHIKCTP
jgi:hypothetical protein